MSTFALIQPIRSVRIAVLQAHACCPHTINALNAGPTNFGPTAEAATPWVQLAMYTAMRAGPLSVVLVCGQRLWRLPPQLLSCTHCLIWPWNTEAVRAHVSSYIAPILLLLHCLGCPCRQAS